MARPLPGTELYETCKSNGWLTEPIIPNLGNDIRGEVYEREMIQTDEFTPGLVELKLRQLVSQAKLGVSYRVSRTH